MTRDAAPAMAAATTMTIAASRSFDDAATTASAILTPATSHRPLHTAVVIPTPTTDSPGAIGTASARVISAPAITAARPATPICHTFPVKPVAVAATVIDATTINAHASHACLRRPPPHNQVACSRCGEPNRPSICRGTRR